MDKLLILTTLLGLTACTAGSGYIHPITGEQRHAPFREAYDSQSIMAEQAIIQNQQIAELIKLLKQ